MNSGRAIDPAGIPEHIDDFARAIERAGGRAFLVGGFVRDRLLGAASKDFDIEVYGLSMDTLERTLSQFGEVLTIGRAFGVLMVKGYDIDFSVPRRDNKVGRTHKDFRVEFDPNMAIEDAARRRDLTINSILYDPRRQELVDPFDGIADLVARRLRATDSSTFGEDPLRALRVAQFLARFEFEPDDGLRLLCRDTVLDDLPGERLWDEFRKLLLKAARPSLGFEFLRETTLLRFFPVLEAMVDVPQDPEWHPEGTVWQHTMLVVDEAAKLRCDDEAEDLLLMYGALCHDVGKPATTFTDENGRIRSPNHEAAGVEPTEQFFEHLRAPHAFVEKVSAIVRHHLAPAIYPKQNSRPRAYRRLARKLAEAGVTFEQLAKVARADHFGRTTPDALAREHPALDLFLDKIADLEIADEAPRDVVLGRHLIALGLAPGRSFGPILERCREVQDDTGWTEVERIIAAVRESGEFTSLGGASLAGDGDPSHRQVDE